MIEQKIKTELLKMQIDSSDEQINLWLEHLYLLQKWNKTYKMTSITNLDDMIVKHLYDSLSVHSFIKGDSIIDVGTGAGFPGVPLAILFPQKHFTLVDSIGKKIQFLNYIKQKLNLKNITVIQTRIEELIPEPKYNTVISRAFSSLKNFYATCNHLTEENGQILAMQGSNINQNEFESIPLVAKIFPISVSSLDAKRHVVSFTRK